MDCQDEQRYTLAEGTSTIDFKTKLPKFYKWSPKEDITAFEVAQCMPVFAVREVTQLEIFVNSLSENCRRHFIELQ